MTDLYGERARARDSGIGTNLAETIPGMRPGSHLWNLLVAVAYLVFAPVLIPLALACLSTRVEWNC